MGGILRNFGELERDVDSLGAGTPGADMAGVHTSVSGSRWRASLTVSLGGVRATTASVPAHPLSSSSFTEEFSGQQQDHVGYAVSFATRYLVRKHRFCTSRLEPH